MMPLLLATRGLDWSLRSAYSKYYCSRFCHAAQYMTSYILGPEYILANYYLKTIQEKSVAILAIIMISRTYANVDSEVVDGRCIRDGRQGIFLIGWLLQSDFYIICSHRNYYFIRLWHNCCGISETRGRPSNCLVWYYITIATCTLPSYGSFIPYLFI